MKRWQNCNPLKKFSALSDQELIKRLSEDDKLVFNYLIELYYVNLSRSALKYVRYEEPAEEIVQDVFVSLWDKRKTLQITDSLSAYLFTAVKYASLNYLKKEFRKPQFQNEFPDDIHPMTDERSSKIEGEELERLVASAIQKLPEKCRIIFNLSRNSGLTYHEIAQELDISVKTVETQISIALSRLRAYLERHWDKIILLPLACLVL